MGGVIENAVASAMSAVASHLPELTFEMISGGCEGRCALVSSAVDHEAPATSSAWKEARRYFARVAEFPQSPLHRVVEIGGANYFVTSAKMTGGAAWFFGTTDELQKFRIEFVSVRRGIIHGSFTASAVKRSDDGESNGTRGEVWVVIVPESVGVMSDVRAGDRIMLRDRDETELTIQGVDREPETGWIMECTANERSPR